MVDPTRQICIESDPREGADARLHRAACHFAATAPGLNGTARFELTERKDVDHGDD
jgi:hypothetical protein